MLLNTKDQADLLFGDAQPIADYLGVSARTVRRWQAGHPMPAAEFKLMQLRYGDLSGLLGPDWDGFTIGRDGLLYHPFYKYGFSADEARGWFFGRQELNYLRLEVKRLDLELSRQKETAWAAVKVNAMLYGQPVRRSSSAACGLPRLRSAPPPAGSFADRPPPPPRRSGT